VMLASDRNGFGKGAASIVPTLRREWWCKER
jgi:hypothetical protein